MRRATACLWAGFGASVLAVLLVTAACTLPARIEASVMAGIRDQIVWQPDSPQAVAARFQGDPDPSLPPVHASFRFFNLTNLAAVRLGAKPVLQEVGPYTFRQVRRKTAIRWLDGDAAVQWLEYKYHMWEPQLSNGSMQDAITTLNLPLIGALEAIGRLPAGRAAWLLELLLSWVERLGDHRVQGLFTTRTAGELLWGYQDPLLVQLSRWLPGINPTFRLAHNMSSAAEAALGLPTQAATGARGLQGVWQTQRWQGVSELTCWNPPHKEAVRGTDASQFRPGLALNDTVDVWVSDLYRAARLVVREAVPLEGVPLLRLRADPSQGDPDPRFFQSIRGLMNVTTPTAVGPSGQPGKPGPPIFLSYPHYCGADPSLARGVEGLACDPPAHDLFVDVEPNTGITLRAAKRLMMSSWFGPKWGTIDPSLTPTFLPIFWAELASQARGPQLRQFRPLLRARAAQRALRTYAVPLAEALGLLAVACFCVATVLWSEQDDGEVEEAGKRSAAAAGLAEAGQQRIRPPPREPLSEPLLDSHPLQSQDAGAAAEEAVAAAAVPESP